MKNVKKVTVTMEGSDSSCSHLIDLVLSKFKGEAIQIDTEDLDDDREESVLMRTFSRGGKL